MSTFVLVHGSAQGTAGWELLAAELQKRGHHSLCVELPADRPEASATFYAERIGAACAGSGDDPVVLAHSASGLFLPLVPDYAPVKLLVYLTAVLPLPGQSFRGQVQADPASYRPDFLQLKPPLDDSIARHYLFHDCPPALVPWALSTVRMMYAKQAIVEETPLQAWPQVPAVYVSGTEDRTINPEWWEAAARLRLGVEPIRLDGGHAPFVSRPADLAALLDSLSR